MSRRKSKAEEFIESGLDEDRLLNLIKSLGMNPKVASERYRVAIPDRNGPVVQSPRRSKTGKINFKKSIFHRFQPQTANGYACKNPRGEDDRRVVAIPPGGTVCGVCFPSVIAQRERAAKKPMIVSPVGRGKRQR